MLSKVLLALAVAAVPVTPLQAPAIDGFNMVQEYSFDGTPGSTVPTTNWNIITGPNNANAELETYTASPNNHHVTADHTLKIIPLKNAQTGAWTSARLESKRTFTPPEGKATIVQAMIRFGDNPIANKQGIWPAFWLLGDSIRHGTPWPQCGEIDILETVNGRLTGYGTVHCNVSPGGICNEPSGIGGTVSISDQGWHVWRVNINRRAAAWTGESITWFRNGVQYMQVTGSRIGNQAVWNSLVAKPLFIIVNVAVGGTFPGNPNGATMDGMGSAMEVGYIAQYVSN